MPSVDVRQIRADFKKVYVLRHRSGGTYYYTYLTGKDALMNVGVGKVEIGEYADYANFNYSKLQIDDVVSEIATEMAGKMAASVDAIIKATVNSGVSVLGTVHDEVIMDLGATETITLQGLVEKYSKMDVELSGFVNKELNGKYQLTGGAVHGNLDV